MKAPFYLAILATAVACSEKEKSEEKSSIQYPSTKKVDTVDQYFGTKIADPYRWLEDDNSVETAEWVKLENKITFDYLNKIPFREALKEEMKKRWNYERQTVPIKKDSIYLYTKNDGIQNQGVLYAKIGNQAPKILIDPNQLSTDGTTALSLTKLSKNGNYLGYATALAGSDWNQFHVLNVSTGEKLSDELNWIKFSDIAWHDNGFYYSKYQEPEKGKELSGQNEYQKVYYHTIGETQDKDVLIYEDKKNPLRNYYAATTDDEKYLIINGTESTSGNSLFVKNLTKNNSSFISIINDFTSDNTILENIGNSLLMLTNRNAPRYKLVLVDLDRPDSSNWKTIIPEKENLLESVSTCNGKIIAVYQNNVISKACVYDLSGKEESQIPLPGLGHITSFNSSNSDSIAFYGFTSYTMPTTVFQYNVKTNTSNVYFKPNVWFNSEDYETKQVFYTSKDGTPIPLFITHKKGIKLDGKNPTFLYGYGGFNISITPEFRVDRALFMEHGGIYAVANIRGGGEYGEEWHKSGTKCNKQNVFDDFIAAAEYLTKEKYTSSEKLAIHGRSNGGLLVGAVMTQRPDIAKVALPTVGVLDMLRYHTFTIGHAWAVDYGTSGNKEEFDCLIKYSPLHNVKEVEYPATMVLTGDHDDRVVPAHSFKFAATLQEKQKGTNPILIRIDTNAGHGSGKPILKQINEFADMWSFVYYHLGVMPTVLQ